MLPCKPLRRILEKECSYHISSGALGELENILKKLARSICREAVTEFDILNENRRSQGLPCLKRLNAWSIKRAGGKVLKHHKDNDMGLQSTEIISPGGKTMSTRTEATKPVKTTTDYKNKEVV